MGLINFQMMWDNYPTYPASVVLDDIFEKSKTTSKATKIWVKTFQNICCIRMSHALNNSGNKVVKELNIMMLNGISGNYMIRVTDVYEYLIYKYGKPTKVFKGNGSKAREAMNGIKGVICFNMNGNGYTGHFDVWDGSLVKYGDHFDSSETYKVSLWQVNG